MWRQTYEIIDSCVKGDAYTLVASMNDAVELFFAELVNDIPFLRLIVTSASRVDLDAFGETLLEYAVCGQKLGALDIIIQRVPVTQTALAISQRLFDERLDERGSVLSILVGARSLVKASVWS